MRYRLSTFDKSERSWTAMILDFLLYNDNVGSSLLDDIDNLDTEQLARNLRIAELIREGRLFFKILQIVPI